MTTENHPYEIQCGEFTVRIPAKLKVSWTDTYSLQIGDRVHALYRDQNDDRIRPRDPKLHLTNTQLSVAKYDGRLHQLKIGNHEMLINYGNDDRGPEALAEYILDATKRQVKVQQTEVNGIQGCYYGQYSEGPNEIEWWFKKGSTMLSVVVSGMEMPSKETQSDIAWIVDHIG